MNESQTFITRTEAIEQLIIPALGDYGNDYDIEAIADEVLAYNEAYGEEANVYRLNDQGFYLCVDIDEFWKVVEKYDLTSPDLTTT